MSDFLQYIYPAEFNDDVEGEFAIDVYFERCANISKGFDLSTAMNGGCQGIIDAINKILRQMDSVPTIGFRFMMIQRGIKLEAETGIQLTGKAPAASAIAKNEYGIKKGLSKHKTGVAFSGLLSLASMAAQQRDDWELYFNGATDESDERDALREEREDDVGVWDDIQIIEGDE